MTATLTVLPDHVREDVLPDTVRPVAEAAWFAWRHRRHAGMDIRNGVYWREDGRRVISLAVGTGLHGYGGVDYETYAMVGGPDDGFAEGVCCHGNEQAAEACALTFLLTGRYCSDEPVSS